LDLVLTLVFYGCAIVAVGGAVATALAPAPARSLGPLAVAIGAAGLLASLSAGFAALVALVCLGASAVLLGGHELRADQAGRPAGSVRASLAPADLPAQLGAAAAALLVAVLLVIAFGGVFAPSGGGEGPFGASAVGRALFGRDALAAEAVGAALLVGLGAAAITRGRRP
jgi:NADH:ubiquinone oxidoreductase subunit 6 (subunit J)